MQPPSTCFIRLSKPKGSNIQNPSEEPEIDGHSSHVEGDAPPAGSGSGNLLFHEIPSRPTDGARLCMKIEVFGAPVLL